MKHLKGGRGGGGRGRSGGWGGGRSSRSWGGSRGYYGSGGSGYYYGAAGGAAYSSHNQQEQQNKRRQQSVMGLLMINEVLLKSSWGLDYMEKIKYLYDNFIITLQVTIWLNLFSLLNRLTHHYQDDYWASRLCVSVW